MIDSLNSYKVEIGTSPELDFRDVLIQPRFRHSYNITSRSQVTLSNNIKTKSGTIENVIPIVASNMNTVGTLSMARKLADLNLMTCIHKYTDEKSTKSFLEEDYGKYKNNTFITIGVSESDRQRLYKIHNECFGKHYKILICIDTANGYLNSLKEVCKEVREKYPNAIICAGNVAYLSDQFGDEYGSKRDSFLDYIDIVKIGIGPGAQCATREKTGVGYPQLSAILDTFDYVSRYRKAGDTLIMSDGGCSVPGDICKAFCAGSDFVMIGSMLAGHDECECPVIHNENGAITVKTYGMSSEEAMNKFHGGVSEYRTSEGRISYVPYKGPVENTVKDILGGIRSCATYIAAHNINEMSVVSKFVRVNKQF